MLKKILIVDDEPGILEMTKHILEKYLVGFEVEACTALNVPAALAILEENGGRFDLIITDYRMPGQTGMDLVREVTRRWPAIQMLISSGHVDDPELRTCSIPKVEKPTGMVEFVAKVRGLL